VKEFSSQIPTYFDKTFKTPLGSIIPRSFSLNTTTDKVRQRRNHSLKALKLSASEEFF
jgi:hypothetical protein